MGYCHWCGRPMKDGDRFCGGCGRPAAETPREGELAAAPQREPRDKLFCELAYCGFLFWLPLVFCRESRYACRSANQGLWTLILSVACCTAIRILGAVNTALSGTLAGLLVNGGYSLAFIVFLSFMLFLLWKCVDNAHQIHRDGQLSPILFFDQVEFFRQPEVN